MSHYLLDELNGTSHNIYISSSLKQKKEYPRREPEVSLDDMSCGYARRKSIMPAAFRSRR